MKIAERTRKNALLFVTGFIVLSAILPDHKPWAHSWIVMIGGTYGAGVLIGLVSILVSQSYSKLRPHVLPLADELSPLQQELQNDEVFVVFCLSLIVVSVIYLLGAAGVFEGLSATEELSLR